MAAERRGTEREVSRQRVREHKNGTVDPTQNVRELFDAGSTRQDDLRLAERRLQEEKILRVEVQLRAVQHEVALRAEHQTSLDQLESKRLDAVRSVDQLAAKTEADRAAAAVTALATSAATTAETLRSAVNTSATNLATQLDRTVTTIIERIAAPEKSSYTGLGKQAVADPQIERLALMVETLTRSRAADTGKTEGIGASWAVLLGVVALVASLLLIWSRATSVTAPPAQPQVIYVPAPPGALLPTTPQQAAPR
jgi:hypothetical protein